MENKMSEIFNPEVDDWTVTLYLDDDTELECRAVARFETQGVEYVALLPLEGPESESGDVFLYRYVEDENGEPGIDNIADDEEYEIAADAYDEYLDDLEYEQLMGEDD